jgi:hypothetical protein
MKTIEQNTAEVLKYLRLTTQHRFLRGTCDIMTIIENESGEFYEVNGCRKSNHVIDVEWYVKEYMNDAKNVIKNRIFYKDHGYKSIKGKYYDKLLKEKWSNI